MEHIQHLFFESLVKLDHFQKEPPLNLKGTTGAQGRSKRFLVAFAPGHHGRGHPREFVGKRNGGDFGGPPRQ
jgi:hypothetical protein